VAVNHFNRIRRNPLKIDERLTLFVSSQPMGNENGQNRLPCPAEPLLVATTLKNMRYKFVKTEWVATVAHTAAANASDNVVILFKRKVHFMTQNLNQKWFLTDPGDSFFRISNTKPEPKP
jgi:hypothetical protein